MVVSSADTRLIKCSFTMSSVQAALLVLLLTAHSSVQLEDAPGCYTLVQISQLACMPAMPGEDFVDKTSRLNFQATCDFNASAGYLHINYDTLISGIIIQYTCQSSNGTILADTILCDVTVGVRRFTFDSDAEVCFFYGCFRDNVNFDIACYVNSTNVTTCRKETLQSSSVSTQSTSEHATVMPTITATASSNTTVSENSQSLSSSAESILMTGSQSLSSSPATTQANQQTNGSSSLSVGFKIGIVVFGFVLILIVDTII